MTIDVLPTVAKLIGAELPKHTIDGKDIGALLRCEPGAKCPHEAYLFYYQQGALQAVRSGQWKLMLPHTYRTMQGQPPGRDGVPGKYRQAKVEKPELYDLSADVGEMRDVAAENPEVVKKLLGYVEEARQGPRRRAGETRGERSPRAGAATGGEEATQAAGRLSYSLPPWGGGGGGGYEASTALEPRSRPPPADPPP